MIIIRSPLRISIGGGGTDIPSYYERKGSFFISAAINKYVYVTLTRPFEKGISDFWFISSSQNIDIFSSLYNYFHQYNISSHVSSYEHSKRKKLNLNFYKFRGIDHEAIRRINKSEK